MTPLEQMVRDDLAALAARTPQMPGLAHAAIGRARAQRRRRAVWATGAALVAVLAVTGTAVVLGHGPAEPTPPASSPSPSAQATDFDGVLRYRGAEVPVPKAWLNPDRLPCGSPIRDAAYIRDADHPVDLCDLPPTQDPSTITAVVLAPWDYAWADPLPQTGELVLPDGRTQLVTRVPAADLRFVVTSPDPDLARRIFDSLEVQPLPPCADVWLTSSGGSTVHVQRDRATTLTVHVGDTITTTTNGPCNNTETTPQTLDDGILTGRLVPPSDDYTRPLVLTASGPGTVRVTVATGQCNQLQLQQGCIGGIAVLGFVDVTVR